MADKNDKDEKPCINCSAYKSETDECGVLVKVQATPPPDADGKADIFNELLFQRPCQFSLFTLRMARCFINKRGLSSKIEAEDIHNEVAVALMQYNLQFDKKTYDDFRRYVTTMTWSAVQRTYKQIYGYYHCGTCAFFLSKSGSLPSRCGNPELQPVPGQEYILVAYSTDPKEVRHSEDIKGKQGCQRYSAMQWVDWVEWVDGGKVPPVTVPPEPEVEDAVHYMESIGPRQHKQADLIRRLLEGYSVTEIAELIGENRTNVAKQLNGENKSERDDTGEELKYRQSGALDVFRGVYSVAIFELERLETDQGELRLWPVVDRRDFRPDAIQPRFDSISKELGRDFTRRVAVERYIAGWNWIKSHALERGKPMSGGKVDKSEGKSGQSPLTRRIPSASEMQHPDFDVLLAYAEEGLERVACRRIAAHLLICRTCEAELEHIEAEVLPELERPITVSERLRWLAARLVGQVRGVHAIEPQSRIRITLLGLAPVRTRGIPQSIDPALRDVASPSVLPPVRSRGTRSTLVVESVDDESVAETYRFLTILDEDETGQLYLFMSIYSEQKDPVYCWPVEGTPVELTFFHKPKERHLYQAYLTDRAVSLPEGISLDSEINADERDEERQLLVSAFLEALERGEVMYRAATLEIKP